MRTYLAAALALVSLAASPTLAQTKTVEAILTEAGNMCASFENGAFEAPDAITEFDLDQDGTPEVIIDEGRFTCSSMACAFCGSGGCGLNVVSGEKSWRYQAEAWRIIDWDTRPILLIARDGAWCGGAGAQVCYEALTLSNGDMLSVLPPAN